MADSERPDDDVSPVVARLLMGDDTQTPALIRWMDSKWADVVFWVIVAISTVQIAVRLVSDGQIPVLPLGFIVASLLTVWLRHRRRTWANAVS